MVKAAQDGTAHFVAKPYTGDALLATLQAVINAPAPAGLVHSKVPVGLARNASAHQNPVALLPACGKRDRRLGLNAAAALPPETFKPGALSRTLRHLLDHATGED